MRGEVNRVAVVLRDAQDCQRVLRLDVENSVLVMDAVDAERARASWAEHEAELRKSRKAHLTVKQLGDYP